MQSNYYTKKCCYTIYHGDIISGAYEYAAVCTPTQYYNSPAYNGCILYIHCGENPATVKVSTIYNSEDVLLQPGEVRQINYDVNMFPINGAESKAIRLVSDAEIQVILFKESKDTPFFEFNEAYEVPSINNTGTFFFTAAYDATNCENPSYANQFFMVTSFYDDTDIVVTPKDEMPYDVSLPSFGTYAVVTFDYADLVAKGTQISSNLPINVVAGNLCQYNKGSSGTYLSNIPPVKNLEKHYMTPHLISENIQTPGFSLNVMATEDDTMVQFNDQVVSLPLLGDAVTFELEDTQEWMPLECSKNCLAVQFTKSETEIYGLFMLPILPVEEFYTSAFFTTLDTSPTSYFSLAVEGEDPGSDILLNGDSLGYLEWSASDGYATAETDIPKGTYVLVSETGRRFAVYVYCHSQTFDGGAGYAVLSRGSGGVVPTGGPTTTSTTTGPTVTDPVTTTGPTATFTVPTGPSVSITITDSTTAESITSAPNTGPTLPTGPSSSATVTDPTISVTTMTDPTISVTTTTDSTVSATSTTSTPPPIISLPQLSIRLNGTVYTSDGQDISLSCAQVKQIMRDFCKVVA